MNEMRVASMALAAYLASSAERRSITMMRSLERVNGVYKACRVWSARGSLVPMITRSGFHEVVDRVALLRNSGLAATANSCGRAGA